MRIVESMKPTTKELLESDEHFFRQVVEPLAVHAASHFNLDLRAVDHKKFGKFSDDPFHSITLGVCYPHEKRIKILIRPYYKGKFGDRLDEEMIIQAIAHELAHLRHADHSDKHKKFWDEIFRFIWFREVK